MYIHICIYIYITFGIINVKSAHSADFPYHKYYITQFKVEEFYTIEVKLVIRKNKIVEYSYVCVMSRRGCDRLKYCNIEMACNPNKCPAGAKCRHYTVGRRGTTNVSHRLSLDVGRDIPQPSRSHTSSNPFVCVPPLIAYST